MKRSVLAVVLGYLLWTALWLGGNALLLGDQSERMEAREPLTETAPLLLALGLSILCSLSAGALAGKITSCSAPAVTLMGFLLLATGLIVQWGYWDLMPLWYHLIFLFLLLPMVRIGATITGRGPGGG